ncbi:MAG TPA: hypothetical protein VFQ70_00235 [Candidatus Saccharimonadaceae bacterium]|nr:hypothetical protein [Candidatus Saccharimonadaceae bacterium]
MRYVDPAPPKSDVQASRDGGPAPEYDGPYAGLLELCIGADPLESSEDPTRKKHTDPAYEKSGHRLAKRLLAGVAACALGATIAANEAASIDAWINPLSQTATTQSIESGPFRPHETVVSVAGGLGQQDGNEASIAIADNLSAEAAARMDVVSMTYPEAGFNIKSIALGLNTMLAQKKPNSLIVVGPSMGLPTQLLALAYIQNHQGQKISSESNATWQHVPEIPLVAGYSSPASWKDVVDAQYEKFLTNGVNYAHYASEHQAQTAMTTDLTKFVIDGAQNVGIGNDTPMPRSASDAFGRLTETVNQMQSDQSILTWYEQIGFLTKIDLEGQQAINTMQPLFTFGNTKFIYYATTDDPVVNDQKAITELEYTAGQLGMNMEVRVVGHGMHDRIITSGALLAQVINQQVARSLESHQHTPTEPTNS